MNVAIDVPSSLGKEVAKANLGISLLKLWLSFEVVLVHFWSMKLHPLWGGKDGTLTWFLQELKDCAVPCFMLATFLFAAERFVAHEGRWFRDRLIRLVFPCAVWTAVTFAVFTALPPFSDFATPTWRDFAYSVLGTNTALGAHLWFMAVLVILTGFFGLFFRFVPARYRTAGLWTLLLAAIALEHSGVNHALFKTWHHDFQRPMGRVIPMIPYACLGLMAGLSRRRWPTFSRTARLLLSLGALCAFLVLLNFTFFVKPEGYHYTGLRMLTNALALTAAAYFLPLEGLPYRLRAAIVFVSRYTMGVYMIHILVGRPLQNFVFARVGLERMTFSGSVVIFLTCWTICFALSRLPSRWIRSLVQ